jgi:hypothetical protein
MVAHGSRLQAGPVTSRRVETSEILFPNSKSVSLISRFLNNLVFRPIEQDRDWWRVFLQGDGPVTGLMRLKVPDLDFVRLPEAVVKLRE